jgi:hypothetical protein
MMKIEDEALIVDPERCTMLLVQTVEPKHKYRSSQMVQGLFIAGIVTKSVVQKDISNEIVKKY